MVRKKKKVLIKNSDIFLIGGRRGRWVKAVKKSSGNFFPKKWLIFLILFIKYIMF